MTYLEWCQKNNCSHGHCPRKCEHPQPFYHPDLDNMVCGKCYHDDERVVLLQPCNDATCQEEHASDKTHM